MKHPKIAGLITFFIAGYFFFPQQTMAQMTEDELWVRFDQRQGEHYEAGRALLTWGTSSLIGGSLLMLTDLDDYGLMMAGWGLVHTAIAGVSLLNPATFSREENDISDLLHYEQRYNRIKAISAGLSISYLAAGLGMAKYGEARRTREFGAAVFTQGAFLLIYDSVLLFLSSRYLNEISLYPAHFSGVIDGQTLSHSGGLTLKIQF